MRWLVEMRDSVVYAIDGECILNQIVCADTEESHFAREDDGGDSRTGDLDHRANFSGIAKCRSGATQFFLAFVQDRHGAPQFIQTGNHREHDFHIAGRTGPKDRAQLGFKDVGVFEAKTDRAPSEERINLVSHLYTARPHLLPST